MEEAVAQLSKGLALLPGLADGPQRSRQELELRAALCEALFFRKAKERRTLERN
jgi:hypothetical protein